jgi:hypothetical protein
MANSINVNQNNNNVSLQDANGKVIITDDKLGINIEVTQPVTSIVTVSSLGPQGQAGITQDTGSLLLTSSFNAFTASYYIDSASFDANILNNSSSIALLSGSFETFSGSYNTGSFTGSFYGDGSNLTGIVSSKWTGSNPITREGNVEITGSLIVSGSSTFINIGPAIFSGSVTSVSGFTGSLLGTAASASYASTASYALSSGTSIDTGSFVTTSSFNDFTSSYDNSTGSFLTTGSNQFTGSQYISGSITLDGLTNYIKLPNGSAVGDIQNIMGGYPDPSGSIDLYVPNGASWVQMNYDNRNFIYLENTFGAIDLFSGSQFAHWGFSLDGTTQFPFGTFTSQSGQLGQALVNDGNGNIKWGNVSISTGSLATTGSNIFYGLQTITASAINDSALDIHAKDDGLWAFRIYNDAYSSSSIGLASWIDNTGISFLGTETDKPLYIYNNASYYQPTILISSSGVIIDNLLTVNDGITGSLYGTSSWSKNTPSASYAQTASYVLNTISSSYSLTASSVTTLNQDVLITGSLTVLQGATIYGSSSFQYVTASQLSVSASYISVNVFEPVQRFGGLYVYDSGSSNATASLSWDSLNDRWVYTNASGSNYEGGMLLSGPRNFNSIGNEPSLTKWFIARSDGGDHLDNSQIYSSASTHIVTGSLTVTEGITGSLLGTSSWASNAQTSSYIVTAQTASYVTTAQTASYVTLAQTASFVTTAQTASYVTTAQTASFVTTAQTASYVLNAVSASFSTTSSYVTLAQTASFVQNAQTASYVTLSQTSSYIVTAQTASYVTTAQTASYVLNAVSASYAPNTTFPFTGPAKITGSLTVTGSIYTNSIIYSPFTIALNFESTAAYTYKAPYAFYILSSESDPSGSILIKYQASGSASTSSYAYGSTINKFDKLIITPPSISLIILNSVRI